MSNIGQMKSPSVANKSFFILLLNKKFLNFRSLSLDDTFSGLNNKTLNYSDRCPSSNNCIKNAHIGFLPTASRCIRKIFFVNHSGPEHYWSTI